MNEFETLAKEQKRGGLFAELWLFLRQTRKWWLLPMIVILTLLGFLLVLSSTGVGPFIYALF